MQETRELPKTQRRTNAAEAKKTSIAVRGRGSAASETAAWAGA